eukprot:PhF_6_TR12778/c0_g1_i1/m.20174
MLAPSTTSTAVATTTNISSIPSKKLPADQITASVERLAKGHSRGDPLPPLLPKKPLAPKQMEESVNRLYKQAIEHKKALQAEEIAKLPDMSKHVALTSDVLQSTFARLHDGEMQRRQDRVEKLKQKYVIPRAPNNTLGPESVKVMAERLYNKSLEHSQEKQQELYNKYIKATEPQKIVLSKDQMKASADRLSKKA